MTEKLDPKSADDILKKYDKESDTMMYKGVMAKIVSAIAITFSVFQLYTATFGVLDAQLQRAVHLGFGLALVYLLYLGMLAWLAWHRMGQLWPALVVPASAFVVGTLVRKLIDRPRPYTALGFTPLFPKDKTGQSMPSRHCFSAAAIAGAAWFVLPPLGAVLAVLGVLIAISRVVTGVHYISDVLAGLAFGSVFAVLGWNAFVLAASALGFYAIMLL